MTNRSVRSFVAGLWAAIFFGESMMAANPIVENKGLCDPAVRIYNNRIYLYATHDFSPKNHTFVMKDWWIWSSSDLVEWVNEAIVRPEDTYHRDPSTECWATDGIGHNGKYYFYFSMGPENIGVVMSDTPTGPWKDPLGKPLVPKGLTPVAERDPAIFQQADGTAYLVFGCWDYYIARLGDDRISLAEPPRKISFDRVDGPYGPGKADDKPYLHTCNGHYYLSWGCYYAMSDNVYGPYTYKGCLITPERTGPRFRQPPELTMDRHACFFEWHHQWYMMCNDRTVPDCTPYFRNSVLAYVHYHANGEIEPIYLDQTGVGQYDAGAGTADVRQTIIQAENFYDLKDAVKAECPEGGFEMRGLHEGSYLKYPNVRYLRPNTPLSLRLSCGNPAGGTVEVRKDAPDGELLGSCAVADTGGWSTYKTVECQLRNSPEKQDIYLVFRGNVKGDEICRLDWFCFNRVP